MPYALMHGGTLSPSMERVVTYFNKKEAAKLREYAKRKKISMYALAKRAIFEYVEMHP